jgi:hypothetical protein
MIVARIAAAAKAAPEPNPPFDIPANTTASAAIEKNPISNIGSVFGYKYWFCKWNKAYGMLLHTLRLIMPRRSTLAKFIKTD